MKLSGNHLVASFLVDKTVIPNVPNFIRDIIKLLKIREIKYIGIFDGFIKVKNFKIETLTYEDLFSKEDSVDSVNKGFYIYFTGKINKIKVPFGLYFFNYKNKYFCMDFDTTHFEIAEEKSPEEIDKNLLEFLKIAKEIYFLTKPLYALIAEEDFVPSPEWIISGEKELPHYWAFYSKSIVDLIGMDKLLTTLKGAYIVEKLHDGGLFFAIWKWSNMYPDKKHDLIENRLLKLTGKIRHKLTKFL